MAYFPKVLFHFFILICMPAPGFRKIVFCSVSIVFAEPLTIVSVIKRLSFAFLYIFFVPPPIIKRT